MLLDKPFEWIFFNKIKNICIIFKEFDIFILSAFVVVIAIIAFNIYNIKREQFTSFFVLTFGAIF